jgi:hypothetical protein
MTRLEWFRNLIRMIESGEYGTTETHPIPPRQPYRSPVERDSYNYGYCGSAEVTTPGTP